MNNRKIFISAVIIFSMILPLTACGKGKGGSLFDGSGTGDNQPLEIKEATHYFETNYLDNLPSTFKNLGRVFLAGDYVIYRGNDNDYMNGGIYAFNINTGDVTTLVTVDETFYEYGYDPAEEHGSINDFTVDKDGNVYYLYHTWRTDPIINETDFSQTTEADLANYMIENWGYASEDTDQVLADYYEKYKKDDGTPDYGAIMKNFRAGEYPNIENNYLVKLDRSGNELYNVKFDGLDPKSLSASTTTTPVNTSAEDTADDAADAAADDAADGGTDDAAGDTDEPNLLTEEPAEPVDNDVYVDSPTGSVPAVGKEFYGGYVIAMSCDNSGNLYVSYDVYDDTGDYYFIEIFDGSGQSLGRTKNDTYVDSLFRLSDGSVAVKIDDYEAQKSALYRMDQKGKIDMDGGPVFSTDRIFNMGSFLSESELLFVGGSGIEYIKNGGSESELYLKWLDCDISGSSVMDFSVMPDGRIVVYTMTYEKQGSRGDIIILNEIDKSQMKEKTVLRLATVYFDSQFETQVVEFNKKNNDYHIDVIEYEMKDGEEDYDAALNRYIISLLSDDSIDILALNYNASYNHVINFAQKGLLIDLNEVIANDPEISTDMFVDNVIAPFYFKDKLVALPSDFGIVTLMGKTSAVGSKMGWSGAEAEAAIANMPDGSRVTLYNTREDILKRTMCANYSALVDNETGKCNFDNDVFKDILKFASHFPEEINYDEIWDSGITDSEMYRKGTLLLSDYYVGNITELQLQRAVFGDDITMVGYPVSEGNGAVITYSSIYAITSHCEDPASAWQLLRTIFLPRDEERYYYSNSPIRKDDLEKKFKFSQDPNNTEIGQEYNWNGVIVKIEPASDADIEMVRNVYFNTTAMDGAVPQGIMDIVFDEAGAYFAGQKPIDEIAKNVQSRVKIYLSETR